MAKIKNDMLIGIICGIILLLFSYAIFGMTGARTMAAIIILFFIPSYLIINNFELEKDEKIIYSFFLGIGIFPSIAYWLGIAISSLSYASLITFVMLIAISYAVRKLRKAVIQP